MLVLPGDAKERGGVRERGGSCQPQAAPLKSWGLQHRSGTGRDRRSREVTGITAGSWLRPTDIVTDVIMAQSHHGPTRPRLSSGHFQALWEFQQRCFIGVLQWCFRPNCAGKEICGNTSGWKTNCAFEKHQFLRLYKPAWACLTPMKQELTAGVWPTAMGRRRTPAIWGLP